MNKPLTAIEKIAELSSMAHDRAIEARGSHKARMTLRSAESKGYNEGKNAAFAEAHEIMKREIERLRYRFQNGALSMDDFAI